MSVLLVMKIQAFTDDRPYAVEIYRTDEALFIRCLPKTPKQLWKTTFYVSKLLVGFFLLMPLMALIRGLNSGDSLWDIVLVLFAMTAMIVAGFGLIFWLLGGEQSLIRVDRQGVHGTSWFFGKGSTRHMPRKLPLGLAYSAGHKAWYFETDKTFFGGYYGVVLLKARPHEIAWIAEQLRLFDAEVPGDPVPEKYRPPKNDPGRSILDTLEFRGQTLRLIPDPVTLHAGVNATREADAEPGLLRVRCTRCNGIVPTEHLWQNDELGKCPACGAVFSVPELTELPEPKRHRIQVTEDDDGLHLAQKPAWINMASFCLAVLLVLDLGMAALLLHFLETTPGLTLHDLLLEKIRPDDATTGAVRNVFQMLALAHVLCLPPMIWMWFGRRCIDFTRETVRFRIGLFMFENRWTVRRTDVGVFYGTILGVTFFHGFRLPYRAPSGRLRSVWLPATEAETPWLVSRVYRWCLANPPHGNIENFGLETISHNDPHAARWHDANTVTETDEPRREPLDTDLLGVAEGDMNDVRLFCPKCTARLTGEEIDAPGRRVWCRNCGAEYSLENAGYFILERERRTAREDWRDPPKVHGLSVHEFETPESELIVRFRPRREKWYEMLIGMLGTLFFFGFGLCVFGMLPVMMLEKFLPVQSWLGAVFVVTLTTVCALGFFPHAMLMFAMGLSCYDYSRSCRAGWTIRLNRRRIMIVRCYGKHRETVEIERSRIGGVRLVDGSNSFFQRISGSPIFGRFPSILCSRGAISLELILTDGTIEYLPQPMKESQLAGDRARWLKNRIAEFLAKTTP